MILVQSLEPGSAAEKGDHGEDEPKVEKDGEVKVEPTLQAEEEDIETIVIDQEETKPTQILKSEMDSKKAVEKATADGDQEVRSAKIEGAENDKDKPALIVVEKASVQDASPIPDPGSKIKKETPVSRKPEAIEAIDGQGQEDDKPSPPASKPDKLLPTKTPLKDKNTEGPPSGQELNKSKSSPYHPDPVSSPSNPLKPLPNIDDGITKTKSEPRLPLLPPIGSKKITALQNSNGALKSHSATGIAAAMKEQPRVPTEKRKDRESAPSSDQASTKKKKKSTDSLRSTSGSSVSKSKKSSSSNSSVSLGQKSKSRESLKSGPQNRLSGAATSKSSDNLANGAAKKLSISRESLKAASQVYSSVPAPKSGGELVKKGDSGKGQVSKSKEAVKAEKERKSGDQKPPEKEGMVAPDSKAKETGMPESGSGEKKKDGNGSNQDDGAKEEQDSDTKEGTSPPTSVENQTRVISNDPPTKLEKTDKVAVTVSEEKPNDNDQTSADHASPKEEAGKRDRTDEEACDGDAGENSVAKEVKHESLSGSAKTEPTTMAGGGSDPEKEQVKLRDQIEGSPPKKPTEEKTKVEVEKADSNEAAASSTPAKAETPASSAPANVKIEDRKVKDDTANETTKPQEHAEEAVTKPPQPRDLKELTTAAAAGSETTSQILSSEFACKLEIDEKTGQSEQSIVEAVEKSTEPPVSKRDISTPA